MVKLIHKERIAEGSTRRFLDGRRNDAPLRPNRVAKFRESHHNMAKLFSAGLKGTEIAARTGYAETTISQFNNDPAFQELVTKYRDLNTQLFLEGRDEFYHAATKNMLQAERQLSDKMDEADEEGELLPTRELVSIVADRADRFGYGKRETKFNVNVDFADALQRAIKRSGKTIDGSVSEGTGGMKLLSKTETLASHDEGRMSSELLATPSTGLETYPGPESVGASPGDHRPGTSGRLDPAIRSDQSLPLGRSAGAQPNGVVPPGAAEPRSLRRRLL